VNRLARHRFRRTTIQAAGFTAFLAGIGLANTGRSCSLIVLSLLLAALALFKRRTWITLIVVGVLGLSLGVWRGAVYVQKLAAYQALYGRRVTFTATAVNDGVYGFNSQLTFDGNNVRVDGRPLPGKVQISGFGVNAVFAGDVVEVSGTLQPGYGASQAELSFAELTLTRHQPSLVASLRRKFAAGLQTALPEPLAPFGLGLLIGQRATLPDEVKQDLLMVGLTHIIAVSGYNLTIILQSSGSLLAGRSRRLSLLFSLSLIGGFVLLAGSSASIIRAAIVSMLSIVAGYYGRRFKPLNLILLAACITAWANPNYIWKDPSWWLSFLAFYGVLVLAPSLQRERHLPLVAAVALESVCAEIMTLPFILFIFGQMSFVGLLGNVLITTLVPLAMLLTAVAGLAGMLLSPLAGWVAWPAKILLNYMLDTAHLLAGVPHVFRQGLSLSRNLMITAYVMIVVFSWVLNRRLRGKITENKREIERVRTLQMVNH
jgi:competence protein ComEC